MKSAKVMFLALALLFTSTPCFAQGYMSIKFGAAAQFVYMQTVNAITENLSVRIDVTKRVPYQIQIASNERVLVIE